jgi:fatty acid desaturase
MRENGGMTQMVKFFAVLLWVAMSVGYWGIVLLGAGFAGNFGALVGVSIAFALWLPVTTLLTDWLGFTRVWPHNR